MITAVLLGGDDQVEELYLSAISEVMNQMVGASSTALSDLLHAHVNIAPPVTREITPDDAAEERSRHSNDVFIRISFRLEIEDLLASNIMQLLPFDFGKRMAESLTAPPPVVRTPERPVMAAPARVEYVAAPAVRETAPERSVRAEKQKVELKAVKYQSFSEQDTDFPMMRAEPDRNNIDLIIDVPLQVTVLLGKSKKSIKEILELGRGSVIVLDRLAGEMVDVLVNGKLFGRGEVVVIDDNYGVRITELTSAEKGKL
jgi:flagellar motor switch protein FliN/FliY